MPPTPVNFSASTMYVPTYAFESWKSTKETSLYLNVSKEMDEESMKYYSGIDF